MWYGNAAYVVDRLTAAIEAADAPVHALVIDADGMSDVDFTAAERLADFARHWRARGVVTAVARTSHLVPTTSSTAGCSPRSEPSTCM